jgi:hypothetical protein
MYLTSHQGFVNYLLSRSFMFFADFYIKILHRSCTSTKHRTKYQKRLQYGRKGQLKITSVPLILKVYGVILSLNPNSLFWSHMY